VQGYIALVRQWDAPLRAAAVCRALTVAPALIAFT
jgi:hypothetical protein